MNEVQYFYDTQHHKLYSLLSNGKLNQYNFVDYKYENISGTVNLSFSWKPITSDVANSIIINSYVNKSYERERQIDIQNKKQVRTFGSNVAFYQFGKMVCAVDEYGNNFKCKHTYMTALSRQMVDNAWKEVPYDLLFNAIDGTLGNYDLRTMELYIDEDKNIHGFSNDGKHFFVLPFSKEVTIFRDNEIQDDWIAINRSYLDTVEGIIYSYPKTLRLLLEPNEEYIFSCIERYNENHKEKLKRDLMFFINPYGCVYAVDKWGNEVICTSKSFTHVKKGTIKSSWKRIYTLNVLNEIENYTLRKKTQKKKICLYDLVLHQSENGTIWGESEKGEDYTLFSNGEILPIGKGSYESAKEISLYDAILTQAKYSFDNGIKEYLRVCKRRLKIKGIELSDNVKFYTNTKSEHRNVYAKDDKNNEYLCDKYKMLSVKKGTIKKSSFKEIYYYDLVELMRLVVIPEADI